MPAGAGPEEAQESIATQQHWLLCLRHASQCECGAVEGACLYTTDSCRVARALWNHMLVCYDGECRYPERVALRALPKHHHRCVDAGCPVCVPVRAVVQAAGAGGGGGSPPLGAGDSLLGELGTSDPAPAPCGVLDVHVTWRDGLWRRPGGLPRDAAPPLGALDRLAFEHLASWCSKHSGARWRNGRRGR